MADLAAGFPGAVLILTGGEPLTRPDTLELARQATALGLQVALSVDVGWLLTPERCTEIREAGVQRVSSPSTSPTPSAATTSRTRRASSRRRARASQTCAPRASRSSCTRA